MEVLKRVLAGTLGGFVGGALIGLGEAAVVSAVSAPSEYWVFLFGAVSYGLIGAGMGFGWGVLTNLLAAFRTERAALAGAGGLVAAAMGLIVFRFRIIRDMFGESLPIGSVQGITVHVGLLIGAVVLLALIANRLAAAADRRGAAVAGLRTGGIVVLAAAVIAVVLNLFAGGDGAEEGEPGTAKGPNAILLIVDTLRADHIGPYGAEDVETPGLDALAADGVVFEKGFTQSSWTRPSIASIFTSLYAASHSVMHKTDILPDDVTTVAESMREAGYRTSGFVTNINIAPSFNFQQGFDAYSYLAPDFFFNASDSGSKLALYSAMRLVRERFLSKNKSVENYYQDADTVNGDSLPWLEDHAGEPFFTVIHYMDPHDPYFEIPYNGKAVARVETPHPDGARAEELRDLYIQNIEYFDGFLVRLVETLKKNDLYDDTVIAFTSDHGEEFYEHEGWWHGTTLYDEQIHVPLIVKLPKAARAGSRVSDLARSIDIAPTITAAAGVPGGSGWQGRDLFGDDPAPTAVYAEEDHEGNVLESVRTADWKLVTANEGNPRGLDTVALYDLRADPGELRNIAADNPEQVAKLKSDLEALRGMAGASAVSGETGEIDDAAAERLRALGYMD